MKNENLKKWLKLAAGVCIFPAVIVLVSSIHIFSLGKEKAIADFTETAVRKLEDLRLASATDNYICKKLNEKFSAAGSAREITDEIISFLNSHNIKAEFLVWNKNNVHHSNFDHSSQAGNWRAAFSQMNSIRKGHYDEEEKIPATVYNNLRTLFGPHFFPRYYFVSQKAQWLNLLRTDSAMQQPLLWLNFNDDFGLAVFFAHKTLQTIPGSLKLVKEWRNHSSGIAIIKDNRISASNEDLEAALARNLKTLKKPFAKIHQIEKYRIKKGTIDAQTIGIIARDSSENLAYIYNKSLLALNLSFAFITFIFLLLSYLTMVAGYSCYISVRKQILLLFIISTLLPGLALYVLAFDYLQHYESGLYHQSFNRSLSYLQEIDDLYKSEFPILRKNLKAAIGKLKQSLQESGPDGKNIQSFLDTQQELCEMFFLIASTSPVISSHMGIVKDGRVVENLGQNDLKNSNYKMNIMQGIDILGKYFLARESGRNYPVQKGIKADHLASALFQRETMELFRMFMESESFWEWGLGDKRLPTYFARLNIFATNVPDYLIAVLFNEQNLEKAYLQRLFYNLNRNNLALRITALNDSETIPTAAEPGRQVTELALDLARGSLIRPEKAIIDGKEFLLIGHKCRFLKNFNLVAQLPANTITEQVKDKRNLFMLLGTLSILISLSLGLSMANAFLKPVHELKLGVQALKERRFSYRLPELGADEFGKLSQLFNNALIDLEEMSVAATIQQKLVSTTNEPLIYAGLQSIVQSYAPQPFGGCFTEFCDAGETGKTMIIADIKDGGIASCLLLAFVKATLIQHANLYSKPTELFARLNNLLIKCSREGYRKTMGMTFVHFAADKEINIICAGMPAPMIINQNTGQLRPLNIATDMLGAAERLKPTCQSLNLKPGETMIALNRGFYAQNKGDTINKLVQQSLATDPGVFFANICQNFSLQISEKSAKKALSAIIIQSL